MKLVITGFMGCGKTRVARELAQRLNLEMIDLDDRITQREGRSPAQLIKEEGEQSFRSIESDVLQELLKAKHSGVIALGGGAWIEERNRDLLNQYGCKSVWLDVPFEVCWSRIEASAEDRPLGKTREEAEARYARRRPFYALARVHIAVTVDETFEDLVSRIEAALATD
ncbi:MAG TPA: shikimate kinase [Pyrinomonadaceae bacterium]